MKTQKHVGNAPIATSGIDHLLYACCELQRGMDEIESLLGVRPVKGGHHPLFGTHNALLALGPGIYLEIIARDPDLPAPERGALVDMPPGTASRLLTWALRTESIRKMVFDAQQSEIGIGNVETGSRTNPDGSTLRWELTDPRAMPMNGAVPFLISWGNTTHPSTTAPPGGRLVELVIEHPEADRVRRALSALKANTEAIAGDEFRITAKIRTRNGLVLLR